MSAGVGVQMSVSPPTMGTETPHIKEEEERGKEDEQPLAAQGAAASDKCGGSGQIPEEKQLTFLQDNSVFGPTVSQ